MPVFMAPRQEDAASVEARRFRRFLVLGCMRFCALMLAFFGVLGCLWQPDYLFGWLGIVVAALAMTVIMSVLASRLALQGGRMLLAEMRDDPARRSLLFLLSQLGEAEVLLQPVMRFGRADLGFDLVAVTGQSITFLNTASSNQALGFSDTEIIKTGCTHLCEQHALPMLGQTRFLRVQANQSGEVKTNADWQIVAFRDLARFFPRGEKGSGSPDSEHTFRALYNLALHPGLPPIPVQGGLPGMGRRIWSSLPETQHRKRLSETLGIAVLLVLLAFFCAGLGLYLLGLYNYPLAEKVLVPTRAVLRKVLTREWRERLALGQETAVGETHVYATVAGPNAIGLSPQLGLTGRGLRLAPGTELQIVQMENLRGRAWYLVRAGEEAPGWVPAEALKVRHLVRAGTPLYDRPEIGESPQSTADRDQPVALLSIWRRPTSTGEVVWSKVSFLDASIRYVRGDI